MSDSVVHDLPGPQALAEEAPETAGVQVEGKPEVIHDEEQPREEGEKEREKMFHQVHRWKGKVLTLSISREAFFEQFRVAVGAADWSKINFDSWMPDAFRLLYLCLVEPKEYRHLIAEPVALQEAIDAWVEETIPREEVEEAMRTAWSLWIHRNDNEPETMPGESATTSDPGN